MYRDFSATSKQNLLNLVSQVESEKISDFTDWIGDKWYDFEVWIGKLNIKNYLNNVNEYHKKVIDKNNTTQDSIQAIFARVETVDTSCKRVFELKRIELQQWQRYIEMLSSIINPQNGKFTSDCMAIELETEWSEIKLTTLADAQDKTTKTFDDDKNNGTYGADQGDMAHNKKGMWFFGFRWFEDEGLYAYIRQQSRYQSYSQTQIADLMERINSEGCGYVAIVNNVFVEYEGREAEFERKFGFPMYDKNGKANYDYLIVDFYANTDDLYYIDEPMGATALVNDVILQYLNGKEDEFRRKYGCDPLLEGKKINPEARQKILDEYQDNSIVTMEASGLSSYSLENRFKHYMEQKDITCTSMALRGNPMPSATEINGYLDNGQNVNILVGDFNLYEENGKIAAKDVGDHWMTITGMTDDGSFIVSSWGKRYYLNPDELTDAIFYITDISP